MFRIPHFLGLNDLICNLEIYVGRILGNLGCGANFTRLLAHLVEKDSDCITIRVFFWQGHKDLNPEPTVLETAALPIELYPYI